MAALDLKIETGFATLPLPGEVESGDLSLVKRVGKGTLIAVVDGLGHGQEAASSAHAAIAAPVTAKADTHKNKKGARRRPFRDISRLSPSRTGTCRP